MMSDFYMQLMSNVATTEFPSNQTNHFKNHLPYPLQFVDPAYGIYAEELGHIQESDFKVPPKNGTEFLNMVCDRYLWALNDQTISDS